MKALSSKKFAEVKNCLNKSKAKKISWHLEFTNPPNNTPDTRPLTPANTYRRHPIIKKVLCSNNSSNFQVKVKTVKLQVWDF